MPVRSLILPLLVAASLLVGATTSPYLEAQTPRARVFTGARVFTAASARDFEPATIVVTDGRIQAVGASVTPPRGAEVIDLKGKFVVPGFVSAHAHVSDVNGLRPRAYTLENTLRQLGVFARYGVTTVWSLGGEQAPAFEARASQDTPALDRTRLYVSGDVITAASPEEAREKVQRLAALTPDVIKIRVDDNLGTTTKMAPEVYRAVIDEAHARGLRVAAHIFYLDDAKRLLALGADVIAHSVRDKPIDDGFIALMKRRNAVYIPTLTRELSTFAYASAPSFFKDPFFLREADATVVADLQTPAKQAAARASASAARYKAGLEIAKRNLRRAADAGLLIAMGTDSGASPERFEGYFEHLEMEMMAEAGLTPAQVLRASTVDAARAMRVAGVGAIAPGAWADFVVLDRNPLQDIRNTRAIASVWIAGNRVGGLQDTGFPPNQETGFPSLGHRVSSELQGNPVSSSSSSSSSRARLAREIADAWTGVPYRIGGKTAAGIGNAEFVREVYSALFDADLEGNVQAWAKAGRSVAVDDLQPGDIVFYDFRGVGQVASQRHAGVYVGDGEFIAAVRESAVTVARLADSRWRRVYKGAVRIDLEGPKGTAGPIMRADRGSPVDAVALTLGAAAGPARRLREITERWRGTPYRFGGTSRDGIDCSAFSSMLLRTAFNVELPRTTEDQERLGLTVDRRKLQPGDLVFFRIRGMGPGERSRHVGVYLGGGQFAQASESQGVTISSLDNEYWSRRYFSARRPPAPTELTLLVDEASASRRIGRP